MKTQREIRASFWLFHFAEGKPRRFYGKTQNELPANIRMAFCDFVDHLQKSGEITETLAARVTL